MARDFSAELFDTPKKEEQLLGKDFSADLFGTATAPTKPAAEPEAAPTAVSPEGFFTTAPSAPKLQSEVPEDEGFFARNYRYAKDALLSGFEGFRTNIKGEAFAISRGAMLRDEEQYGGPGVPLAPPDVKARYEKNKQEAMQYGRDIAELKTKTREREERSPLRPETARLKAAMGDDVAFLESAKEAGAALISNPPGVIADLTAESFPAMAYMVSTALVGRLGLQSPTAGAVAGGVGSAVSQFGNEYVDRLQKGESHEEAWKNAEIRSGVIGIFDAVSLKTAGSAAGKIVNALKTNKPITVAAKEFTKELGIQAGLGGAGEAAGSLAIGEVPNPAAVIAEMAGELGTGPFEAVGAYKKVAKTAEEQRIADLIRELDLAADKEKGVTTDEQGKLAAGAARPDITGRIEPSFQASGEPAAGVGAAGTTTGPGAKGVDVSGVSAGLDTTGAAQQPSTLGQVFAPSDTVSAQQKRTNIHYNTLMTQPDNPVTQSLTALDAAIQKAKDAYTQIAEKLGIPSDEIMGLSARLPQPIANLLKFPSATGSAVRLVNASKDFTSGAKRGSQAKIDSAIKQVQGEITSVDQIIADAFAAAEDPAVKVQVNNLIEQNAVSKGVAARQAEVANLPMEQRAAALKKIEDEVRAELQAKKATTTPTPPAAFTAETAQDLEDSGAIFENELEPAKDLLARGNDLYGVDTQGNVTKLNTEADVAAFHEANKDEQESDFTRGDAGYYVVPKERAAPTTVPDAPTIKENPDAEEAIGYKWARDRFLDGQSDIYHIDPEENVVPVTSLKQLQQLNAEWQGDPDAGFWSVPKADTTGEGSGRVLKMITEATGPSFDATMATLLKSRKAAFNRLRKLFAEGKINAQQFTQAAIKILDSIDDQKMVDFNKSRRLTRGPDIVRQRILEAVRRKKISRETAEFALWLINNNPQVANDLAIKLNLPKDKRAQAVSDGTAGYYDTFSKLVRAILRRDPDTGKYYDTAPEVLVHEILHHTERMLPAPLRKLIRKEWEKQLLRAAKKADASNDQYLKEFMALLMEAYATGNEAAEKLAHSYIIDGTVPKSYYALTNPSEFWAVNGSDILYGRYKADTNFGKIKQWFSEFIEAIKRIFGLNSKSAVIKGLQAVLNGDGTFVSRYILSEGTAKAPMITPAKEAQVMEKMLQAGKMNPLVLEALANNDLSGALKIIADRTKGFYGDLARVLSQLNLPTTVVLNNPADLISRQINEVVKNQQFRLFDYLQRTYPDIYDKYFLNYDRSENLEQVHEGLRLIKDRGLNVGPVTAEFEDVLGAYNKNIKGLVVPGFFAPEFDAISLLTESATNDVLLHEVLHAATSAVIDADFDTLTPGQQAALEQLEKMFEYAKQQIPLNLYGFTDLHEFISELFTNKAFRERLQKIEYTPTKQPLFTAIARAIYRLFGINNLAGNAMAQATQLFSAVRTKKPIPIGIRFAKAPRKPRTRGPATGNWRAQEDYGNSLVKLMKKMMVSGKPWPTIAKDVGKAIFRAKYSGLRRVVLPNLGLRHLADLTKFGFPQLTGAVRIVEQMLAYRQRSMTKAADIVRDWTKLMRISAPMERLMGRVMVEATLRGIDPDTAPSTALPPTDPLAKAWALLPAEFKAVYRRARDYYSDALKETLNEMKSRIMKSGKPLSEKKALLRELNRQFGADKLVKPYFPLRRFGQYWFQVGKGPFKEFVEFESESVRNLAMEVRKEELIKKGRKDLADTILSGNGISELYTRNAASTKVLGDVQELIDNISSTTTVADAKQDLKNSIDQLVYILLPQQSMRKMFINRQGVQGASADMLRVFSMTSFHTAYQQSRFKFAESFLNNINNAREYVDEKYRGSPNGAAYRDFIMEVEKRNPQIMSNEEHSKMATLSSKVSELTFFYMLTAPATALVNILGFPQLVMSTLGGDYGYAKTYGKAFNLLRQYGQSAGRRTIVPLATGNFLQAKFPSIFESGLLTPFQQKAADRFMTENDVNISLTSDIMNLSDRPSELYTGAYEKGKQVIAEPLHQSERMMREIGLMTAFELAYEKLSKEPKRDLSGYILKDASGKPLMRTADEVFEDAIQEARDKIGLSLGDFNRQMKPRTMAIPGLNILFIFKTFAIFAGVYILRNSQVAMFGPLSKSERADVQALFEKDLKGAVNAKQIIAERMKEIDDYLKVQKREALRRMAGVFGTAALLGGLPATPFFSIIGKLIAMLIGPDDDEDEFFDWENWFRNYCEVELGGYASDLLRDMGASEETAKKYGEGIGISVARGPVGTMMGGSLSDRVSLDLKNMWIRDPRYTPDTRQEVFETAVAAAGPAAGLAMNFVDAYDYFQEGKIDRAMEKALPVFMSKPLVAYRLSKEGAKTASGRALIEEFSAWELAMQAIGLQPERLALKQKSVIEAETYKQKIIDKKTAVMDRLWFEYENGSDADYDKAIEMRDKFNDMYPEVKITPKELKESFERRKKLRREAEQFGANIPKKLRSRIEPMLEYGKED